jgi:hypothetical protein
MWLVWEFNLGAVHRFQHSSAPARKDDIIGLRVNTKTTFPIRISIDDVDHFPFGSVSHGVWERYLFLRRRDKALRDDGWKKHNGGG